MSVIGRKPKQWRLLLATLLYAMLVTTVFAADATAENTSTTNVSVPAPEEQTGILETKKQGSVARAIFTSQIVDREPVDDLTNISNDSTRVFFFTDLRDLAGQIVTHRWEYQGRTMAEVKFKVGNGPRWRVYSSKNLLPEWTGEWAVIITNENGDTLKVGVFNYIQTEPTTDSGSANTEPTNTESSPESSPEASSEPSLNQ